MPCSGMALTRCPECSGQVSDQAATCPHCGYPLHRAADSRINIEERFRQIHAEKGPIQAIKYWREMTGVSLLEAKAFYDQEKGAGRLGLGGTSPVRSGCLTLVMGILATLGFRSY